MRRTTSLLFLALVLLAACERPAPADAPKAVAAAPRATGTLGDVLSVVDTVTLGQWLAAHPGDVVADTATVGVWDEALCRTATARVEGLGGRMVRTALFELPSSPSADSLPASGDPRAWCRLRAVELSIPFPDSASAEPLADSLGAQIAAALGTPSKAPLPVARTDAWRHPLSWSDHGHRVMLAVVPDIHPAPPAFEGEQAETSTQRRLLLLALAPGGSLAPDDSTVRAERDAVPQAEDAALRPLVDSALAMAALPALDAVLRPLLAEVHGERAPERTPERDSSILAAARLVHATAPSLPADRRAAAFTALDFVIEHLLPSFPFRSSEQEHDSSTVADSSLQARLAMVGVTYEPDIVADMPAYTRSLLRAGFAADSSGRGGHPAFLMLTSLGWNTASACGDSNDQFEPVIAHGEADLRRGHEDPLTHYFVGLAWADVVSMGGDRSGPNAHDRAAFARRAPLARTKAIAHLRAAVAGLRDPVLRANAWRVGMALLLGQSRDTRFFCVFED